MFGTEVGTEVAVHDLMIFFFEEAVVDFATDVEGVRSSRFVAGVSGFRSGFRTRFSSV